MTKDVVVIKNAHLAQRMEIWSPKYSSQYDDEYGEPVALLHKGKVFYGSSEYIIVTFTKAKSLEGLRFAIKRSEAKNHKTGTNGKIAVLEIPMSHFVSWMSYEEDREQIKETLSDLKKEGWL